MVDPGTKPAKHRVTPAPVGGITTIMSAKRRFCTMKHMSEVGIRVLKQNASAVVAKAAAGEVVTITSRGRPVALMTPIPKSRLQELIDAGLVTAATRDIADLPDPIDGPSLSEVLAEMREEERY